MNSAFKLFVQTEDKSLTPNNLDTFITHSTDTDDDDDDDDNLQGCQTCLILRTGLNHKFDNNYS